MARPTIGHLDPAFVGMMDETKEGLKAIFKTENGQHAIPFHLAK
jgi:alanine-glyoxylate transaminase/serine-glyoxylate transaminase/serine-pyruvate transaminase